MIFFGVVKIERQIVLHHIPEAAVPLREGQIEQHRVRIPAGIVIIRADAVIFPKPAAAGLRMHAPVGFRQTRDRV